MKMITFSGYGIYVSDPEAIDLVTRKKFKNVKNKQEYPYSYDEFLQWEKKLGDFKGYGTDKEIHGLYSDRLFQWDPKKYNQICRDVFDNEGQYWNSRSPKDTEKFLQLYLDDPTVTLQWIIEGCNPGSGFPYWVFGYKKDESNHA